MHMVLLGEMSEVSFEPDIEGRSDRSSRDVPSGVAKKCVDADMGANHYNEYRRRCTLRRCRRSTTEGRTVRDMAQMLGFLPDESDGSALVSGQSARASRQQSSPTTPGSRSLGRDPVGEKRSLGMSWDRQATQDASKRRRVGER
jgi:hypothetical protein